MHEQKFQYCSGISRRLFPLTKRLATTLLPSPLVPVSGWKDSLPSGWRQQETFDVAIGLKGGLP